MLKRLFLLLLIVLLVVACSPEEETAVSQYRTIRLPMGYIPDPQYAPFYVAIDKGYFAEEGLIIEFDYSFETDGIALVGAGELELAVVSGEQVLLARAQGLPVVSVVEWYQRYPIAIISKTSANINAPADLAGRNVGLPGFFGASYVGYVGLLLENGLTQDDVTTTEIGFNQVESLVTNQSEAVIGYASNEPLQLSALGESVNVIYVADYIDMVANGIISNENIIANEPELVQGFVRAFLHGLQDTLDNPDEAYEISKKFIEGLDDSRKNVLDASLPLWKADTLGLADLSSWQTTQDVLLSIQFMDQPLPDVTRAFTNEFVLGANR